MLCAALRENRSDPVFLSIRLRGQQVSHMHPDAPLTWPERTMETTQPGASQPRDCGQTCALSLAALWIWAQPVPTRLMAFSSTLFSSPPAPRDWSHTQGAPVNLEAFCLYRPFAPRLYLTSGRPANLPGPLSNQYLYSPSSEPTRTVIVRQLILPQHLGLGEGSTIPRPHGMAGVAMTAPVGRTHQSQVAWG